jgi:hypothetical protein
MADMLHELQSAGFDLCPALVAMQELQGDRYAPRPRGLPDLTDTTPAQPPNEVVTGENLRIWLQRWYGHVRITIQGGMLPIDQA